MNIFIPHICYTSIKRCRSLFILFEFIKTSPGVQLLGMTIVIASKWDPHKETIRRLYIDDKISLDELVRVMKEEYNFAAR